MGFLRQTEVRTDESGAPRLIAPEGAQIIELRPDRAYVLMLGKPIDGREANRLLEMLDTLGVNGMCGPVIVLSPGTSVGMLPWEYPTTQELIGQGVS